MFKGIYDLVLSKNKSKLIVMITLLLAASLLTAGASALLMHMIDDVIPAGDERLLMMYIIGYIGLSFAKAGVSYFSSTYNTILILSDARDLKKELIEKIFRFDGDYLSSVSKGELYQTVEADSMSLCGFALNNVFNLLRTAFSVIVAVFFLLVLNWKLILLILILQPFAVIIQKKLTPRLIKLSGERRTSSGECSSLLQDIVKNPVELILSGFKKNVLQKMNEKLDEQYKIGKRSVLFEVLTVNIVDFISALTTCIVIGYSGYCIINQTMTVGELVTFMTYTGTITSGIIKIVDFSVNYAELMPIYERVSNIAHNAPPEKTQQAADTDESIISANNMCFSYDGINKIYDNASFSFRKGKSYSIIGRTGEGKSTFVKLLFGLWKPDNGEITIDGVKCSDINIDSIGDNVAYVSSSPVFLNDTIYNNLTMFNKTVTSDEAWNVLKKVGLYDEVDSLENKMDNVVGDGGMALSTGQRQRLSIARAMLTDKKIIILDEPTSALDTETGKKVIENVQECFKDKMLIIISHDQEIYDRLDEKLTLKNGRLLLDKKA